MNIFKISLSISRAKTFALFAKFFVAVVFIAAFEPVAYAASRYWDPWKRGSFYSPIRMTSSYWATSNGGSYDTSLFAGDDIYLSYLSSEDYYLSLSPDLPLIYRLYIERNASINLTGENSRDLIQSIYINSGTLNLYDGQYSRLNFNSMIVRDGTLRLTHNSNLRGRGFAYITFAPDSTGTSSLIFGASRNTSSSNRNSFVYDGSGLYSSDRIKSSGNFSMEVESFVDLTIKGIAYTADDVPSYGGAISVGYPASADSKNLTIKLNDNSSLLFEGNTVSVGVSTSWGGAISASGAINIDLGENSVLQFKDNLSISDANMGFGGAIYSLGALEITAGSNSTINFSGNESSYHGGAIRTGGALQIKGAEGSSNFSVIFNGNSTDSHGYGGAVYSAGDAEFHNAVFTNNTTRYGGAIYAQGNVAFTIDENLGALISSGNTASDFKSGFIRMVTADTTLSFDIGDGSEYIIGGADTTKDGLSAKTSSITLIKQGAGVLTLNSNSSVWDGKLEVQAGTLNINNTFGNSASTAVSLSGGLLNLGNGANSLLNASSLSMNDAALRLTNESNLVEKNFSDIIMSSSTSGASKIIFGALGTSTNANRNAITYDNQGTASTHRISASNNLVIEVEEYVDLAIKGVNYSTTSSVHGGVIYSGGTLTMNVGNNSSLQFEGNKATSTDSYAYGGAIYSRGALTMNIGNNSSLQFEGNKAISTGTISGDSNGGAIYSNSYSTLTMNIGDESTINFSGNESSYHGGAIYAGGALKIKGAEGSSNFSVIFDGNSVIRRWRFENKRRRGKFKFFCYLRWQQCQ